jgi:hypothetical protein
MFGSGTRNSCLLLLIFALSFSLFPYSVSYAYFGGAGDGGCCQDGLEQLLENQPAMIQKRASDIFERLSQEPDNALVVLAAAGDKVCDFTDCLRVDAAVVKGVVVLVREARQRLENKTQYERDFKLSAINTGFAFIALLLSGWSVWYSSKKRR